MGFWSKKKSVDDDFEKLIAKLSKQNGPPVARIQERRMLSRDTFVFANGQSATREHQTIAQTDGKLFYLESNANTKTIFPLGSCRLDEQMINNLPVNHKKDLRLFVEDALNKKTLDDLNVNRVHSKTLPRSEPSVLRNINLLDISAEPEPMFNFNAERRLKQRIGKISFTTTCNSCGKTYQETRLGHFKCADCFWRDFV